MQQPPDLNITVIFRDETPDLECTQCPGGTLRINEAWAQFIDSKGILRAYPKEVILCIQAEPSSIQSTKSAIIP